MALQPEKRKVRALSLAGIAQISNDISRKFLDRSDLSRLSRIDMNSPKDYAQVLKALDNFFVSDPNGKIKLVFVEDKVIVKNIFIMSSAMQERAQKYPEHLYVDLLKNVSPGFNLYSVSCEDENSEWKICASCISQSNNPDILRFLIVSVLQSIPKMKAQIKYITVHPGITDSLDMGTLLPNATIRLCYLLVLQILENKLSELQCATQTQIKTVLHILLHTRSLKVYNRCLNEFKNVCPAEVYQYYYETWHPSRKLWCTKDNKRLKAEKAIYSYVTSLHYTLATEMGSSLSLNNCLCVVFNENRELKSVPESLPPVNLLPVPEPPPAVPEKPTEEIAKTNGLEDMTFSSWEEFQSFLISWCEEQKIIFVIRSSVPLTNEDMSQDLIQSLKYSTVNLGCSSYTRKRCPATIHLKLGPDKDKLIIAKADLNHIHDSEIDLPSRFTRKPSLFVEFPIGKAADISDKFMDRNELTKLLRLHFPFGGESQLLDELESLFNSDPSAKVKLIYTEDKFIVKNIFLMTSAMQNLLQHFPETMYVDHIPALNQEFDLYSLLCQDESFSWRVCAHCIGRKETSETLRFLIQTVLQVCPNISTQVKYFTVSPEIRNPLDIQALLPNALVRYCSLLVFDSMHNSISFLSQMEQSQIKNLLVSLSKAPSTDVYTEYLADLKAACPDEVFQYYFDTWHPHWKLWCEKDNRTSDLDSSIFAYVEAKHNELKAHLGSLPSLYQCLQAILSEDQQEPVESSELNHVEDLDKSTSDLKSQTSMEESITPLEENTAPTVDQSPEETEGDSDQVHGKEFQSWDDFSCYLEKWSKEKFLVRLSSATFSEETDGDKGVSPQAALSLKYSWVQLYCSWKECPAFIELTLGPEKDKLIITQSNSSHVHEAEETTQPPPAKKCKLSSAVGLPAQVANNISRKFLEPSDLKRLLRFRSGAFEDRTQVLAELDSLFISDPDAKVKLVFVEDKLLVQKIFLMTSTLKEIASKFPENIFIDLFSDFSQSFDLYTIYCEEKGVGWKVCAYCIAKKGVPGTLDFLLSSVVQINPTLSNQTKHLTVNPEIHEPVNLETHLPHSSLRYCMHLVLDILYRKIANLDNTVAAQIKNYLHILSQTCSLKVYNRYLTDLKAICPAEIYQYFYDTWHPRRKMWVKKDNRIEEGEKNMFELVLQKHENLKQVLGSYPSLHQCLCAILGDGYKKSDQSHLQELHSYCENEESPSSNEQDGDQQMMEEEAEMIDSKADSEMIISEADPTKDKEANTENHKTGLGRNEFYSWDDFCSFLDRWCEEKKTMFAVRHSVFLQKSEIVKFPHGPEVAKSLRYSTVILGCRSCPRNKCTAMIELKLSPRMDRLIVSSSNLCHTHDLPNPTTHSTSKDQLQAIQECQLAMITDDIAKKFLECSDVKRLLPFYPDSLSDHNKVLGELNAFLNADTGAKIKLVFNEKGDVVKSIFIMTSYMQDLAQRFPDHIFVDRLPLSGGTIGLYTLFCERDNKKWTTCAYCITQEDSSDTFQSILLSFVQSMASLQMLLKLITVSPGIQGCLNVESVLPNAVARYCRMMVMDILFEQCSHLDFVLQAQIKSSIQMLAQTSSPNLYSQHLFELAAASPPTVFQCYYNNWHQRRKLWASDSVAESHMYSCVKAKQQELTSKLSNPSSLCQCLQVVLDDCQLTHVTREACIDEAKTVEQSINIRENSYLPSSMVCSAINTEGKDMDYDLVGKKFTSWNQFCEYFDLLCEKKKTCYKVSSAIYFENTDKRAEIYKFQNIRLGCWPLPDAMEKDTDTQSNTECSHLSCPASLFLQFCNEENCLVVMDAQMDHNHNTDIQRFAEFFNLCSLSSYTRFLALASNLAQKFITLQDLKDLLTWKKILESSILDLLHSLRTLLYKDPLAKVIVRFTPDVMEINEVFFMTSQMGSLLQKSPPVIFISKPLIFTDNYELYTAMCEDNENMSRVCAYFCTQKGNPAPFCSMVQSILQSIPEMKINSMLLQSDIKEMNSVRDIVPSCSVHISPAYVLEVLHQHLKEDDPSNEEKVKGLLCNLIKSNSSELYSTYFTDLKKLSSDNFLQYFLQNWNCCKEDWCHAMKEDHFLECASRQEDEVKPIVISKVSLGAFIQAVVKVVGNSDDYAAVEDDDYKNYDEGPVLMEISDAYAEKLTVKSSDLNGMIFESWNEFSEFFDSWCEETKTLFKITSVIHLENVSEDDAKRLRYQLVQFLCKGTGGWPQQRDTLSTAHSSCPVFLTVKHMAEKNCLVTSHSQHVHNHTIDPEEFSACFKYCRLSSWPRFASLTSSFGNGFVTQQHLKDILNWSMFLENDTQDLLKELDFLFLEDPKVKLKLSFCSETLSLESVFIMVSHSQHLLEAFSSLLFLGQSLTLNEKFDLYTVLCEDDSSNGREVAYLITRKECAAPVVSIVISLMQSIPQIKERLEGMVLQTDLTQLDFIQDLLPSCCVRMSQTHALDTLCYQMRMEDPATEEELKQIIYNLVHSQTSMLYNIYFKELERTATEHFFQYFLNTWHIRKEDWVESWGHRMKDGNFIEFTAWHANELRSMLSFPSSLASCTAVLLEMIRTSREYTAQTYSPPDIGNKEMSESHMNGINNSFSQSSESSKLSTSILEDISNSILRDEKPANLNIVEGKKFSSWMEFRTFFDRWCERNMYLFKIRCYRPLSRADSTTGKMMAVLKYSFIHLVCKYSIITQCSGRDYPGELPALCQANIIVEAGPQNNCLIVTHAQLDHNHGIAEDEFESLFPRFMLRAKPFLFLEMTKAISKQFLLFKDLQDLVCQSSDEEISLRELLDELTLIFCKDPKVKIKLLFYPDIAEVEGIFLMTATMKNVLQRFPSVLCIEKTMPINNDFYLYTAVCEDADQRGRTCAYFITRKESQTPVRFMVVSLMQSISDFVKPMIKSIVLHATFEELELVQGLLPKREVIMSQAYALQLLNTRIEEEEQSVQVNIKNIVCDLVRSSSAEIYKQNLKVLKAAANTAFLDFFLNHWHMHRKRWVACTGLPEPHRIRFDNHFRINLQSLESVNLSTSLACIVNGLLKLQSLKALTCTLDENKITDFYKKLCHPPVLKLLQEEITNTKYGHYDISEFDDGFLLNDGTCSFVVEKSLSQCNCSIFKERGLPCRHIFAARLWTGETMLDDKLVQVDTANIQN
ncbi:uncharacterized protein zswim9.L isoform X1 [Xenopus laevis]|uniref:Uncharacterized protein zswim9.L isoform X1 n=1 Tax=Xenopus laevis TaxID=8355 RepID=A0A8J0TBE7_XENLA|nr:uncharacterized protein zswim9.L isoform X1 [Xenopus laevis]XP_018081669.1 uncharacterized protein zswim9.L isoform X1 [Xenopus laevis]XP_018081670.1 uncharacterized protein zswim9.L isoform X1 [Xenopus laevis]XP_018081671.1 uncharacterized protein zswim9.L isoform X1 [Xenopus laevis]